MHIVRTQSTTAAPATEQEAIPQNDAVPAARPVNQPRPVPVLVNTKATRAAATRIGERGRLQVDINWERQLYNAVSKRMVGVIENMIRPDRPRPAHAQRMIQQALRQAVELDGGLEMVKLLNGGLDRTGELSSDDDQLPLHLALETGKIEICRHLLAKCTVTPGMMAAALGGEYSAQTMRLLLNRTDNPAAVITTPDSSGKNALDHAMEKKDFSLLAMLFEHLPDLKARYGENGYSLLHLAVASGNASLVKQTVERYQAAGTSVMPLDYSGHDPLYKAATSGNLAAVKFLLKAGADPYRGSFLNKDLKTLFDTVSQGHPGIAALFMNDEGKLKKAGEEHDAAAVWLGLALDVEELDVEQVVKRNYSIAAAASPANPVPLLRQMVLAQKQGDEQTMLKMAGQLDAFATSIETGKAVLDQMRRFGFAHLIEPLLVPEQALQHPGLLAAQCSNSVLAGEHLAVLEKLGKLEMDNPESAVVWQLLENTYAAIGDVEQRNFAHQRARDLRKSEGNSET